MAVVHLAYKYYTAIDTVSHNLYLHVHTMSYAVYMHTGCINPYNYHFNFYFYSGSPCNSIGWWYSSIGVILWECGCMGPIARASSAYFIYAWWILNVESTGICNQGSCSKFLVDTHSDYYIM